MTRNILVINGPNLNLLGTRQPNIYGKSTLADVETSCQQVAKKLNVATEFFQSNHEGGIVDVIQNSRSKFGGIIINAGAYSHTSIAILDALNIYEGFVVEVHVSNIYKREEFRHKSLLSQRADAVLAGFGVKGYELAIEYLSGKLR